jgi:ABC-type branched-subunit amino acid transport system ATPase component
MLAPVRARRTSTVRRIGFVPQGPEIFFQLTVEADLKVGMALARASWFTSI